MSHIGSSENPSLNKIQCHLLNFTVWYFDFTQGDISVHSDFIDDIERKVYARNDNVAVDDVKYSRFGVDKNDQGGITDRGFIYGWIYMPDLLETMGISADADEIYEIADGQNIEKMACIIHKIYHRTFCLQS